VGDDIIPFLFARQTQPLAPFLGGCQAPAPIGDFKGGIALVFVIGKINLRRIRKRRPEAVLVAVGIPSRKGGHELGRLEHQFLILPECFAVGMDAVTEFRIEDRMRLLPDQEAFQVGWRRVAGRSHALGPAGAFVSLALRLGRGLGQDALGEGKAALQ